MTFATFPTPDHWLTRGQLSETEALIRWDVEQMFARLEDEANDIEAALAARKLESQP
jgi:hypothetical protein